LAEEAGLSMLDATNQPIPAADYVDFTSIDETVLANPFTARTRFWRDAKINRPEAGSTRDENEHSTFDIQHRTPKS